PDRTWEILSKSRGKLTAGEKIQIEPPAQPPHPLPLSPEGERGEAREPLTLRLKLLEKTAEGHWLVQPESAGGSDQVGRAGLRERPERTATGATHTPAHGATRVARQR